MPAIPCLDRVKFGIPLLKTGENLDAEQSDGEINSSLALRLFGSKDGNF